MNFLALALLLVLAWICFWLVWPLLQLVFAVAALLAPVAPLVLGLVLVLLAAGALSRASR